MNKLPVAKRATIITLLVEGMSLRAISRITGASINTISKLLVDAGNACAAYHDEHVRELTCKRVQADEIWAFCYSKQKNVPEGKRGTFGYGDVWTYTGICADTKLLASWRVGPRDVGTATDFMQDLAGRLSNRIQLTTDGHRMYLTAVEDAFAHEIDYAMLQKVYGPDPEPQRRYSPAKCNGTKRMRVQGDPDPEHINTSYVERHNLSMRMHMRRFTRLTNAFSKKVENHVHHIALYTVFYNFCRIHKTLRVSPAMEAGVSKTLRDAEWIVGLVDAAAPKPKKPGPKPRESN